MKSKEIHALMTAGNKHEKKGNDVKNRKRKQVNGEYASCNIHF